MNQQEQYKKLNYIPLNINDVYIYFIFHHLNKRYNLNINHAILKYNSIHNKTSITPFDWILLNP